MAQSAERLRPKLGKTALQIIEDIPTIVVVGRTTVDFQRTFPAQLKGISFRLQWGMRQPYSSSPQETQNIELPCTTPKLGHGSRWDSFGTNTAVQEILARATGILQPEETWSGFLNRNNIVATRDWREFQRIEEQEPDKIPGMQYTLPVKGEQVVQYAGRPLYLVTGTRYPGVRAVVQFMPAGHNQVPLESLVAEGRSTMHVTLRVPTSEFLPAAA